MSRTRRTAPRTPAAVAAWLATGPSLASVRAQYPQEWETVRRDLARVVEAGDPGAVTAYLVEASAPPSGRRDHAPRRDAVVAGVVRRWMTVEATRQASVAAATGVTSGTLRLGQVNGRIMQRLFFRDGLTRKPASALAVRLVWPLLTQKRRLLPLVMPEGIYCFYSAALVRRLARIVGDRPCLEIAAGDGTLTRFLRDAGVDVVATDDASWGHDGDDVERLDAAAALRAHRPRVVVCSWPPPGNTFERRVFTTPGVEEYLLVTSRREHLAGDWAAYRSQQDFDMVEVPELSRLVLPPLAEGVVYRFTRR